MLSEEYVLNYSQRKVILMHDILYAFTGQLIKDFDPVKP